MSLVITVALNGKPIRTVVASRVAGTGEPESIGTYEIETRDANGVLLRTTTGVRHRYADGGIALAIKALEAST